MRCISSDLCKALGGTCAEQCCNGCQCLIPGDAPLTVLQDFTYRQGYVYAKLGWNWPLYCQQSPLAEGSTDSRGCFASEIEYKGGEIEIAVSGAKPGDKVEVYIGNYRVLSGQVNCVIETMPFDYCYTRGGYCIETDTYGRCKCCTRLQNVFRVKWPGAKQGVKICSSPSVWVRVKGADCPDVLPLDVELYADNRLIWGSSYQLKRDPYVLMPTIEINRQVLPASSYKLKVFRGGASINCRDLLVMREIVGIAEEGRITIEGVYLDSRLVKNGEKVEVVGEAVLKIAVKNSTSQTLDVRVYAGTAYVQSLTIAPNQVSYAEIKVVAYISGEQQLTIYAIGGTYKSNEYKITLVLKPKGCALGTVCMNRDECTANGGTCVDICESGCCCKFEPVLSIRLSTQTVDVPEGAQANLGVYVDNKGLATGIATVKAVVNSWSESKTTTVQDRSTSYVEFYLPKLAPGTYGGRVELYKGSSAVTAPIQIEKFTYTIRKTVPFEISASDVTGKPATLVCTEIRLNKDALVQIYNDKGQYVVEKFIKAPGDKICFTSPSLPGIYNYKAVAIIGTNSAGETSFRVIVSADPEFVISSAPREISLYCQQTTISVAVELPVVVTNVGGRGACEVRVYAGDISKAESLTLDSFQSQQLTFRFDLLCAKLPNYISVATNCQKRGHEVKIPIKATTVCTFVIRGWQDGETVLLTSDRDFRAKVLLPNGREIESDCPSKCTFDAKLGEGVWRIQAVSKDGCISNELVLAVSLSSYTQTQYQQVTEQISAPINVQTPEGESYNKLLDLAVQILPIVLLISIIGLLRK